MFLEAKEATAPSTLGAKTKRPQLRLLTVPLTDIPAHSKYKGGVRATGVVNTAAGSYRRRTYEFADKRDIEATHADQRTLVLSGHSARNRMAHAEPHPKGRRPRHGRFVVGM